MHAFWSLNLFEGFESYMVMQCMHIENSFLEPAEQSEQEEGAVPPADTEPKLWGVSGRWWRVWKSDGQTYSNTFVLFCQLKAGTIVTWCQFWGTHTPAEFFEIMAQHIENIITGKHVQASPHK